MSLDGHIIYDLVPSLQVMFLNASGALICDIDSNQDFWRYLIYTILPPYTVCGPLILKK